MTTVKERIEAFKVLTNGMEADKKASFMVLLVCARAGLEKPEAIAELVKEIVGYKGFLGGVFAMLGDVDTSLKLFTELFEKADSKESPKTALCN